MTVDAHEVETKPPGSEETRDGIAIIGMAGRFPGARDVAQFWSGLRDGVESISFFSDEELIEAGVPPAVLADPYYVKARGRIDGADEFDAPFFDFTPKEAALTDPQHRVILECAWAALEHAAYDPARIDGLVGVYAGASMNSYVRAVGVAAADSVHPFQFAIGNDKDFLATRIAYKLNLHGPSLTVQTACSTSLVAVHVACEALLGGECDVALAGGVSLAFPQAMGHQYQEGGIASPDGHCRAFDADARGTVLGAGVGLVVLRRLDEALDAGDTIHAVIRGSGINNDGSDKVGFTAPSVRGQAAVIRSALAVSGVPAETIGYVEAHGTGTPLGDPIELAALTEAFREQTDERGFCAIGSVKTNIGHLDVAAGVAGLIKTTMALEHGQIPPSLHFREPNPELRIAESPFYVNDRLTDWPAGEHPRRAGVSSFGIGGTNAHVVLEQAPAAPSSPATEAWQVLPLSARSPAALDAATANLGDHLERHDDDALADVAFTLQVGRRSFEHRRVMVARSRDEAIVGLGGRDPAVLRTATARLGERPAAVFMFPGQGAQRVNMARSLHERDATFREAFDRCADAFASHLDRDLREVVFPGEDGVDTATDLITQTQITQPTLFTLEYALAQLWQAHGVQPAAMIGHSIGELVAATIAGVFSFEDAVAVVAARGRLMAAAPIGSMLVVPLPEADLTMRLKGRDLALAAVNAPSLCVASGPAESIDAFARELDAEGVETQRLRTSHAFHSPSMDDAATGLAAFVGGVRLQAPTIPFVSNVTGTWITEAQATDPGYWAKQLRHTVRFGDGVAELLREPNRLLLEVGPGRTLSSLAALAPAEAAEPRIVGTLAAPGEEDDTRALALAHADVWLAGGEIDWHAVHAGARRRRIPLPTYPFERRRHWLSSEPTAAAVTTNGHVPVETPAPARDPRSWLYAPTWVRGRSLAHTRSTTATAGRYLVFGVDAAWCAALVERLRADGNDVVTVAAGARIAVVGTDAFELDPESTDDYGELIDALAARDDEPRRVLHLWAAAPAAAGSTPQECADAAQRLGLYSVLNLVQALSARRGGAVELVAVSANTREVTGGDLLAPQFATLSAACRTLPREYNELACRHVDIDARELDGPRGDQLAAAIVDTLEGSGSATLAFRGGYEWSETVQPLEPDPRHDGGLRQGDGVVLITGGLGGIGLAVAEALAREPGAKVALLGRTPLPPREDWDAGLRDDGFEPRVRAAVEHVRRLEQLRAEVRVHAADVTDHAALEAVVADVERDLGQITTVVHAAGVPGGGIAELQTRAGIASVLAPKVTGTLALAEVFEGRGLGLLVLCSSMTGVSAPPGQIDYCAANVFLDAFARSETHGRLGRVLSIDWDRWTVGMAARPDLPASMLADWERDAHLAITPEEGAAALAAALAAGGSQTLVSTTPPGVGVQTDATATAQPEPETVEDEDALDAARAERVITDIWGELLGVTDIDADQDFFELGGHSWLAVQANSKIRAELSVALPLRDFLAVPTIRGVAAAVVQRSAVNSTPEG